MEAQTSTGRQEPRQHYPAGYKFITGFRLGAQGNPIGKAPDGRVAQLDKYSPHYTHILNGLAKDAGIEPQMEVRDDLHVVTPKDAPPRLLAIPETFRQPRRQRLWVVDVKYETPETKGSVIVFKPTPVDAPEMIAYLVNTRNVAHARSPNFLRNVFFFAPRLPHHRSYAPSLVPFDVKAEYYFQVQDGAPHKFLHLKGKFTSSTRIDNRASYVKMGGLIADIFEAGLDHNWGRVVKPVDVALPDVDLDPTNLQKQNGAHAAPVGGATGDAPEPSKTAAVPTTVVANGSVVAARTQSKRRPKKTPPRPKKQVASWKLIGRQPKTQPKKQGRRKP